MSVATAAELSFELRPASNLQRIEDTDSWYAATGPVQFELDPGERGFPSGWVLLTGRLTRTILDGSANLLIERDGGELSVDIPVSAGGSVFELVKLPPGIRRLVWQPSRSVGTFSHTPLRVRKVGVAERRWLMTRRVAYMLWKQPAERKREVGLEWLRACIDLPGQYRACGMIRAYIHPTSTPYAVWLERYARLSDEDRKAIRRRLERMPARPRFALVVRPRHAGMAEAGATFRSIESQLYRAHAVLAAGAGEPVEIPKDAEYVAQLDAGDQLAEHALYWIAEQIVERGDVAMAYADEDVIAANGTRSDPKFKPDWSPEHLRSINYVGRCVVFRRGELAAAGGIDCIQPGDDGHELALRVAKLVRPEQVVHVPALLFHRSISNVPAKPRPRARYPLPETAPLVSILIPTRDRLALLRKCIESIELRTSYRNHEIVVIDNRSSERETLDYLAALRHRVVRYDAEFNYSAINNLAVRAARGEAVLLLNNDIEVISPDWLEEMLGHLHQEGVGAVGAKLFYADGRVQHAGDGVGAGGCADHLHSGLARDAPGYCHRAVAAHEVSAVTGACLMTWKQLYQRLGGLDEAELAVSFNDVDYCLRLQQAGYRVVFTPHAELYHFESATRGHDASAEQEARAAREVSIMRRRWGKRLDLDPYYNPNLNYARPDFSLAGAPRVRKPWLK
jgi:GT2 family glycosyltransferase